MTVEIKFTIDLKDLHKEHEGHCLIAPKFADMVSDLNDRYEGADLELSLSKDAKEMFKEEFSELFNY
jgi:hypothetical protein